MSEREGVMVLACRWSSWANFFQDFDRFLRLEGLTNAQRQVESGLVCSGVRSTVMMGWSLAKRVVSSFEASLMSSTRTFSGDPFPD